MDFMMIGSLNSYARSVKLKTQWDLKKNSGDVTSHADRFDFTLRKTPEASMLQRQIDEAREDKDGAKKLKEITDKALAGKKLTPEEKRYLQAKDPVTYQRLEGVESDRKSYERELKQCRTRDDVQRLKARYLNQSLMTVKAVANNPHIPDDKKKIILETEKLRTEKIDKATRQFVKSGAYAKLPTDREKAKAEAELREAKRAEETGETRADKERPDTEERAARGESGEEAEQAKKTMNASEEAAKKSGVETPEQRKLRRSKARAAYAASWAGSDDADPLPMAPALDVEA